MTDALKQATHIVQKLTREGYVAYFAGGWVRDYVMGHPSEDIDIATNALPAEIMDLFPHTILVGLAFGVVIVVVEGHQFEVATFRRDLHYLDGRRPEAIELSSTPQDDAYRRDFTINGMFYDPIENVIHDYVQGREDIKHGIIRTIGNPHERFFEDRLRMLRAFRFAARFAFFIDPETQQAIIENADKLFPAVAMERIWQEFNKMSAYPRFDQAIIDMHRLSLLAVIFPELETMHLNDLRHLVHSYAFFPKNSPMILYLMELFQQASLEQKIEISKRIKASNRDIKLLEFFEEVEKAARREKDMQIVDEYQWTHLLAHPDSQLCLTILAARLVGHEQQEFKENYQKRFKDLEFHIKRVQEGKPLVSAALLQQHGIKPGKQMGLLLKEAERIAIKENLHQSDIIISKLSKTPLWETKS
jgi:poly(A) polymerase